MNVIHITHTQYSDCQRYSARRAREDLVVLYGFAVATATDIAFWERWHVPKQSWLPVDKHVRMRLIRWKNFNINTITAFNKLIYDKWLVS